MHYTAVVTKEGKQPLAEFRGCPGCQTFADPDEDIAERAEEALAGWLQPRRSRLQPHARHAGARGSRAGHAAGGRSESRLINPGDETSQRRSGAPRSP
jgi:predicted RNase H-like HicB family nuclease